VLFGWVFAEQIGLPIPSMPILLAVGALSASGEFSFLMALLLAVLATLICDLVWYQLGRYRGHSILNLMCRISLEPDSCVRNTQDIFVRRGVRVLLVAKFLPGLGAVASPMAGMIGTSLDRFLLWDSAGALLWAAAFSGLGYIFSGQLERVAAYALRLGAGLGALVVGSFAGYLTWKYQQRRRFLRSLRIAGIAPEELKRKLDVGEDIVVVDLRSTFEFDADNVKVPGSIHILPDELDRRHEEIPRDRDVVLYCT